MAKGRMRENHSLYPQNRDARWALGILAVGSGYRRCGGVSEEPAEAAQSWTAEGQGEATANALPRSQMGAGLLANLLLSHKLQYCSFLLGLLVPPRTKKPPLKVPSGFPGHSPA